MSDPVQDAACFTCGSAVSSLPDFLPLATALQKTAQDLLIFSQLFPRPSARPPEATTTEKILAPTQPLSCAAPPEAASPTQSTENQTHDSLTGTVSATDLSATRLSGVPLPPTPPSLMPLSTMPPSPAHLPPTPPLLVPLSPMPPSPAHLPPTPPLLVPLSTMPPSPAHLPLTPPSLIHPLPAHLPLTHLAPTLLPTAHLSPTLLPTTHLSSIQPPPIHLLDDAIKSAQFFSPHQQSEQKEDNAPRSELRSYRVAAENVQEENEKLQECGVPSFPDIVTRIYDDFYIATALLQRFDEDEDITGYDLRKLANVLARPLALLDWVCAHISSYERVEQPHEPK